LGLWVRNHMRLGNLAAAAKPKTAVERQLPLSLNMKLPDAEAGIVSAALYNRDGVMMRTLLAGAAFSGMNPLLATAGEVASIEFQ